MWQRVQTLYLAIATLLLGAMFFCDKADEIPFTAYTPYLILLIVVTLLNVIALSVFRIRMFQMRTAILAAIIIFALQGWLVVDYVVTHKDVLFHIPAVFPAVAGIFDILAARNIFADELMVRNSSRLRAAKRGARK